MQEKTNAQFLAMLLFAIIFLLMLLTLPEVGLGQTVFKCADESGTVIFSQSPCDTESEELYIQDSQSGISSNSSYYNSGSNFDDGNYDKSRDESQRIQRIQSEAKREFDKRIKEGWSADAAARAAEVVLSKTYSTQGDAAHREFDRRSDEGWSSQSAQNAAKASLMGKEAQREFDRRVEDGWSSESALKAAEIASKTKSRND